MNRTHIDNIDNDHDGAANNNDGDRSSDHDFCSSFDHPHYCFAATDGGSGLRLFAHYQQRQLLFRRRVLLERRPRCSRRGWERRGHHLRGQQRLALGTVLRGRTSYRLGQRAAVSALRWLMVQDPWCHTCFRGVRLERRVMATERSTE